MPSGLFFLKSLDRSISNRMGLRLFNVSFTGAATPENVHADIGAQRRFRSACAFLQSDKNLYWVRLGYQKDAVSSCGQRRL